MLAENPLQRDSPLKKNFRLWTEVRVYDQKKKIAPEQKKKDPTEFWTNLGFLPVKRRKEDNPPDFPGNVTRRHTDLVPITYFNSTEVLLWLKTPEQILRLTKKRKRPDGEEVTEESVAPPP